MDRSELRHLVVAGKVQGVSFRRFVEASGRRLGLTGYVRNLADGRVEVLVSERNDEFEAEVARGPVHSRVDLLSAHDARAWPTDLDEPTEFTVLKDGEETWFQY